MDYSKAYLLLMIVKESLGHPKLAAISAKAMEELVAIDADLREPKDDQMGAAPFEVKEVELTPEPDLETRRKEQEEKLRTDYREAKVEPNPPRSVLNEPAEEPVERRI